jgi:hypothetical protein
MMRTITYSLLFFGVELKGNYVTTDVQMYMWAYLPYTPTTGDHAQVAEPMLRLLFIIEPPVAGIYSP